MATNLFNRLVLETAIGKNGIDDLKKNAIDAGTAFMSGQVTNAASSIANSKTVSALSNMAAAGAGTFSTISSLMDNSEEMLTTYSKQILATASQIITSESTRLITDYSTKHLRAIAEFPSKVTMLSLEAFDRNKVSIGELLKEMIMPSEDISEAYSNETKEKNIKNFITTMKTQMNDISDKAIKYTNMTTSYIGMVLSYIQNGPDWVVDQLDKQMCNLVDYIEGQLDTQWEKDKKVYDDKARALGEAIGTDLANKYNDNLKNAQQNLLNKTEKIKTLAIAKINCAKLKALSVVASLTGIYIPI